LLCLLPALAYAALGKRMGVDSERWTDEYDAQFKKYAKRYFGPGLDWRWFKAQGIAESGLRADAISGAGAKGIMQIMPSTFEEIRRHNPHFTTIDEPRWNIAAGIFYDRQLYKRWRRHLKPSRERLPFTFASYNAGYGTVLKAYKRVGKTKKEAGLWHKVAPFAPPETRSYVARIHQLMDQP
jgi:membrane-bound lytic murein transglycosylase F